MKPRAVAREIALAAEGAGSDLRMLSGFLSGFARLLAGQPEFSDLLAHPALKAEDFRSLVKEAAPGAQEIGVAILEGLAGARSLRKLGRIAEELEALADDREGVVAARVASARPLSEGERKDLAAALAKALGRKVRMEESQNPGLLGGVRVEALGRVYDGSMKGQLEALRKELRAA